MPPFHSDDVPEALRETTSGQASSSSPHTFPLIWVIMTGIGAIALGAITALLWPPVMKVLNNQGALSQDDVSQTTSSPPQSTDLSSSSDTEDLSVVGDETEITEAEEITDALL
ncbi:MAG: hypothetical protein F6K09_19550, partial [Merismopedia sp. SIO2A8]|nr:hypothetical protein [Merismopedia sp. SIO2A8]